MGAGWRSSAELEALLEAWVRGGWLRPLDQAFARFLARQVPDAPSGALLAAALASHQAGRGHVCLDLPALVADPGRLLGLADEDSAGATPGWQLAECSLQDWRQALDHPALVSDGGGTTPLVLRGQRLYLRRYWDCEQRIAAALQQRLARRPALAAGLDPAAVAGWLGRLFQAPGPDWQRMACTLAAGSAFTVITGGPGTGKTTTVLRLLALLQAMALEQGAARALRIRLAAPTGKAAARLNAALAGAVRSLPLPGNALGRRVREAIPLEVQTVHRLLGSRPGSRRLRHHAGHPLAAEVLVVDEASMLDLELAAALLDALPAGARLVLLGDRDQLASVEAGAVLGELCARAAEGHYTAATADWLARIGGGRPPPECLDPQGTALDQHVVMLRHSHRFAADSGIGRLARAVNAGDAHALEALERDAPAADLARMSLAGAEGDALERFALEGRGGDAPGYLHYLEQMDREDPGASAPGAARDAWALGVLQALEAFQLLCALRRGPWGVEGLNARLEQALRARGWLGSGPWYPGRPVLVTGNDYALGLMNGDLGVALAVAEHPGAPHRLRVAFPAAEPGPGVRWVLPSRLLRVETAFALTVHKAQGSEFDHVALVLPDRPGPVLTRELIYTGVTRARRRLTLVEPAPGVLKQSLARRVQRSSGLGEALWGPGKPPEADQSPP